MNYLRTILITLILFITVNPSFSATALELMNEGKMNLYRGDIREGIRILETAQRMDNENLIIKLILAKGYSWNNEWEKAKSLYTGIAEKSAPSDQIHWEARFGIAQITSWDKKYDEALVLYREILQSYKKISKNLKLDINLAIGDIYSWKMENDEAISHFNGLLADDPGNPLILNRIAKIYLWMGDYEKSREYTAKVLSIDSKDAESSERIRILNQIKPFTLVVGYDFTYYDSTNTKGENVKVHNTLIALDWQYSNPLKIFLVAREATQNSIESEDPEKTSEWSYDVNMRAGASYRINPLTFITAAAEYTYDAKIFPDFGSEISISRKLNSNIDIEGLYKYTYDKIDSVQTVESKQYHLISPGIVFYYTPAIYNRLQFYVETDKKDLFYSVLIHQYLSINPENILQFYFFLSQGRTYMTYSDTSIMQKTTTYSATIIYTHFFTPAWGVEFATGLLTSVDNYSNYHAGISVISKW